MRIIPIVLLVVIILMCLNATTLNPRQSIVLIESLDEYGTGVIIGPNVVLTAAHVAKAVPAVIRTLGGDTYDIQTVVVDPDSDLARLYVDGTFKERPLKLNYRPLCIGDKIRVIGTPFDISLTGCVLPGNVVFTDFSTVVGDTQYANLDVIDTHSGPGCSGGPVIDRFGNVCGIVAITYRSLTGIIPVEELDGMVK